MSIFDFLTTERWFICYALYFLAVFYLFVSNLFLSLFYQIFCLTHRTWFSFYLIWGLSDFGFIRFRSYLIIFWIYLGFVWFHLDYTSVLFSCYPGCPDFPGSLLYLIFALSGPRFCLDFASAWTSLLPGLRFCLDFASAWTSLLPGLRFCLDFAFNFRSFKNHPRCYSKIITDISHFGFKKF